MICEVCESSEAVFEIRAIRDGESEVSLCPWCLDDFTETELSIYE